MTSMPRIADDLSEEWLTSALRTRFPDIEVRTFDARIIGLGEGFMGQLARVGLDYETPHASWPQSLIVKFASPNPETRKMARDRNLYHREIGFYRDIGNAVGVPVPDCYFSHHEVESNHFVLLLEDLAPGEPSDQVEGTDRETSRQVIEHLARLHAKWWNDDRLEQFGWARWIINETPMGEALAMLERSIADAEASGRFDAYPTMKRLMYRLPPLFAMEPAPPYPFSLTHGDLRSDNIIRPTQRGGRFAIIDWQLAGKGDPINDLVRWLVQSISIEDRQASEQDLLKLYHERLLEHGVTGYPWKAFINAYKVNLIVVLLMFSMSMDGVDQTPDRAKALFHEFYSRLDSALADWEIEKLLRVLPYMIPFMKLSTWLKLKFGRPSRR